MSLSRATPESPLLPYLRLLRAPNVFTAVADVLMGYLVVHRDWQPWTVPALLVGSSSCLYLSGMVLNDWFDRRVDAAERPERPIPAGKISAATALALGLCLMLSGVALGWSAAATARQVWPGIFATAIAAPVLTYNGGLKGRPLGPVAMGGCRMLNVLLGMGAAGAPWGTWQLVLAGGIGVYVAGITIFARSEATQSGRVMLAAGLAVMLAGVALAASYPEWATGMERPEIEPNDRWYLLWALLAAVVGWRCISAIVDPTPQRVQTAVKNAILSLIVFDAAACTAVQPIERTAVVLLLIVPSVWLGRWVYST